MYLFATQWANLCLIYIGLYTQLLSIASFYSQLAIV